MNMSCDTQPNTRNNKARTQQSEPDPSLLSQEHSKDGSGGKRRRIGDRNSQRDRRIAYESEKSSRGR